MKRLHYFSYESALCSGCESNNPQNCRASTNQQIHVWAQYIRSRAPPLLTNWVCARKLVYRIVFCRKDFSVTFGELPTCSWPMANCSESILSVSLKKSRHKSIRKVKTRQVESTGYLKAIKQGQTQLVSS